MTAKGKSKIYTHLWYATAAEEAARFYAAIFPDSRVDGVWSLPSDSPSGPAGSVKVVDFTLSASASRPSLQGPTMSSMVKLDIAALEKAHRS
jgi:predicted 3-demethylubiquinone-9 3-methyltransferase (glyoxalase superfamily)